MHHLSPIILPGQGACRKFESRLYQSRNTHATDGMRQSTGEQADPGCDQPSAPPKKTCAPEKACAPQNAIVSRPWLPKGVASKNWNVCFDWKAMEISDESLPPGHPDEIRHQNKTTQRLWHVD